MLELTQLSRSGSTAKAIGKLRGFTLIELMITVAILGILATIALPAFTGILATTRVNSAATDLWSAMQFARSEAVRNNRTFTVCATTDGTSCAAAGTSFSNGWLVRQGPAVLPTGAPVTSPTRVYPALRPTINVTGSGPIEYSSLGRPISTTISVAFNITAPANRTRYVCIVNSGLPEVRNTPC